MSGGYIEDKPNFSSEQERKIYQEFFRKLPDSYEQFVQNKADAFNLFCRYKVMIGANKISHEDSVQFQKITQSRATLSVLSIFSSALAIFYLNKGLRYRNIIYGLTYRFTLMGFLMKFYLMPQFVARGLDTVIFEPQERSLQQPILERYDLNDQQYRDMYFRLKNTLGLSENEIGNQFSAFQANNSFDSNKNIPPFQPDNNRFGNSYDQVAKTDFRNASLQQQNNLDMTSASSSNKYDQENQNRFGGERESYPRDNTQQNNDYYKTFRN